MQLIARTLRYLAQRFLADPDSSERSRPNQNTARTNAAEASARLRKRRTDKEDVEAYLQARRQGNLAANTQTDQSRDGTGHTR